MAICLHPAFSGEPADTTFVLVKKTKGISLYERWHTLESGQAAREVKAVLTVDAAMQEVSNLIKNESLGTKWNKSTNLYRIADADSDRWVCYMQYDLPWPVSNQECVLQYNQYNSGDNMKILFSGIKHPRFPEQDGIDRIHEISGKWEITPDNGGIRIQYYITTTPSKTLPRWITDPIIRNNLIDTMRALREILEGSE